MEKPTLQLDKNTSAEMQALIEEIQNNCKSILVNFEELNHSVAKLNALDFPINVSKAE